MEVRQHHHCHPNQGAAAKQNRYHNQCVASASNVAPGDGSECNQGNQNR
jgi:hypothetical protein